MCGIHGEYFPTSKLSSKNEFKKINDYNSKRGPDQEGIWSNDQNCSLGFRRLSILDVSDKGAQPMKSKCEKFMMVFNGEIYNFRELKIDLVKNGYKFKGESDSEVLVNCFDFYGAKETVKKLDGMFAIALYDLINDFLYLIRDFAGIKPLFYGLNEGNIVFGSRYDQVSKHPLFRNQKVSGYGLSHYLRFQNMSSSQCILENTFQVEPGEIICFDSKGIVFKEKYWEFPELNLKDNYSDNLTIKFKNLLFYSVEGIVQTTDVGIGSFLSGGIDSPIVTALAKNIKTKIQTFSLGSDSKVHDETEMAMDYAKAIGTESNFEFMNSTNCLDILDEAMDSLGEPFADISLLPTYLLSKKASEFQKVMISGDGGDELFFGYERFESVYKNKKWNWIPQRLKYFVYGLDKVFFNNVNINGGILQSNLGDAHKALHQRFSSNDILRLFNNVSKIEEEADRNYINDSSLTNDQFLQNMRKSEFLGMMQKTLAKVDRMSMANSLEVRVPFLRKEVLESAFSVPPTKLYDSNREKPILKDVLKDLLPNVKINNKKMGFSVPLSKWIKEDLKDSIESTLFKEEFLDYFEISKVNLKVLWDEHQTNVKDRKWELFTLYSLSKWYQNQLKLE